MSDVETLLRATLESHLGDVDAKTGLPATVRRRAKRGRVTLMAGTAAATAFVVTAASLGATSLLREGAQEGTSSGIDIGPVPVSERQNGVITYSLPAGGPVELHSVEPDGSNDRVIPTPQGQPWHHAWSPDGAQLAVTIFPPGVNAMRSLWVMNPDGSNAQQVAQADNVSAPSWSPDGEWIAYSAKIGAETSIHVVRPDGSENVAIHAEAAEGTFAIFSAHFSPDGKEILFDRGTDSGYDIFVMNTDGSNVRRLTATGNDYDPNWSPDGTKIVFTREDESDADENTTPTSDIFVMDADGTNVTRLTQAQSQDTFLGAVWSPDGTKIAYNAGRTGGPGPLLVMNADGSAAEVLVPKDVLGISWQPRPATDGGESQDDGQRRELSVSAYLVDDITPTQRHGVRKAARRVDGVTRVRYVSKRAAYQEFKQHYRDEPEFWENLPKNALPARFDIRCADRPCVTAVIERMHELSGVDEARRAEGPGA